MQIKTISTEIKRESFITLSDKEQLQKLKKIEYLKEYRKRYKKRVKRITLTLNLKEYQELEKEAKNENISINQLSKKMIFAYKNQSFLLPKNLNENLREFIFLVRNIANNINQIAKQSNSLKLAFNIPKIFKNLQDLEEQVKKFVSNPPLENKVVSKN